MYVHLQDVFVFFFHFRHQGTSLLIHAAILFFQLLLRELQFKLSRAAHLCSNI